MTQFFLTPAARLSILFAVATTTFLVVFGMVVRGWDFSSGSQSVLAPILAQDLRFWAQVGTGLGAFMIAAWIWALKPRNFDVMLFALSGLATLTFTFSMVPAGAIGVTLAPELLSWLYRINAFGASLFGIVMTVLLLRYPVRLPFHRALTLGTIVIFGGWTLAALLGPLEGLMVVHTITFLEMLCMCAAVIAQYWATRTQPKERAIAIWLGMSIILGSGIFIALVAAPIMLGFAPLVDERYGFSSFLIVYVGLAIGLTRYRVFELGEWAFYVLFYVTGALILIAIDVALIFLLSVDVRASLGASLLIVALLYLPSRDFLWRTFLQRKRLEEHVVFQAIIDVAFEPASAEREGRWHNLFIQLYDPLEIVPTVHRGNDVAIEDDGATLYLPATTDMHAMLLQNPWRGRGLFGPRHLRTAHTLIDIMRRAEASRHAYDTGVSEERTRIARDMHDNIGAQLMSALHSPALERKDLMIGQTLSDLRDIIRNATRPGLPIEEALADLRAETAERFEPTGIALNWTARGDETAVLSPDTTHAMRSLVREGVSNVIRHSSATSASVDIAYAGGFLTIEVRDDGRGVDASQRHNGTGLQGMQDRVGALNGTFDLAGAKTGTVIKARLPLHQQIAAQ